MFCCATPDQILHTIRTLGERRNTNRSLANRLAPRSNEPIVRNQIDALQREVDEIELSLPMLDSVLQQLRAGHAEQTDITPWSPPTP